MVGHVKMTFVPKGVMVSCGVNDRRKTVPWFELPPPCVVPYRVLPDELVIKPANGTLPSLPVKLCKVVRVWAATGQARIKPSAMASDRLFSFCVLTLTFLSDLSIQ